VEGWTYNYDNGMRLKNQTRTASGVADVVFSYAYDAVGRVSSFNDGTGAKAVTWDHDSNRLSYGNQLFGYNADDSIKTATDASGGNTRTFTYDASGAIDTDGCSNFTHDGFDRLEGVSAGAGPGCQATAAATYQYDGMDRQRQENTGGTATDVHYDGDSASPVGMSKPGDDIAYSLEPNGTPQASLSASTKRQVNTDGRGNVTNTTDTGRNTTCTAAYDSFGSPTSPNASGVCRSGNTTGNELYFQGSRRDPGTGTYQFGARTYAPASASFLTPDNYRGGSSEANLSVAVDPLTRNTYAYVNGDPVNFVDLDGHRLCNPLRR
jgi:RHS repeat-associated protein